MSKIKLEIPVKLISEGNYFLTAKYNIWQSQSILRLISAMCKAYDDGFERLDKDEFVESLDFLIEITLSALDSCSTNIECIETIPDFEKIYVITQTVELMQLENKTFDQASEYFSIHNLPKPIEKEVNDYIKFLDSLEKSGGRQ